MANTRDSGDKVLDWQELKETFQGLLEHFMERFGSSEILIKEEETDEVIKSDPGIENEEQMQEGAENDTDEDTVSDSKDGEEGNGTKQSEKDWIFEIDSDSSIESYNLQINISKDLQPPAIYCLPQQGKEIENTGKETLHLIDEAKSLAFSSEKNFQRIAVPIIAQEGFQRVPVAEKNQEEEMDFVIGSGEQEIEENKLLMVGIMNVKKESSSKVENLDDLVSQVAVEPKLQLQLKWYIIREDELEEATWSLRRNSSGQQPREHRWGRFLLRQNMQYDRGKGTINHVRYRQQNSLRLQRNKGALGHMGMTTWIRTILITIWAGPFNNMGQEIQQKKGVEQWLCKETTALNELTNQSSSVFYTKKQSTDSIRLAGQLLEENRDDSEERWLGFREFNFVSVQFWLICEEKGSKLMFFMLHAISTIRGLSGEASENFQNCIKGELLSQGGGVQKFMNWRHVSLSVDSKYVLLTSIQSRVIFFIGTQVKSLIVSSLGFILNCFMELENCSPRSDSKYFLFFLSKCGAKKKRICKAAGKLGILSFGHLKEGNRIIMLYESDCISGSVFRIKMTNSFPIKGLRILCERHNRSAPCIVVGRLNVGVYSETWESAVVGSINTKKRFMLPIIKPKGRAFQLTASYFFSTCIGMYDSMIRVLNDAQQTISKDLMIWVEFDDDQRASTAIWSREVTSIPRNHFNLEVSASRLLKRPRSFEWLIAWKLHIWNAFWLKDGSTILHSTDGLF